VTYEIRFTPDALSDMREHNSWYERKRLGLGVRFSSSVSEQVKLLIETPELYRIYYREIRRCSVRSFPYEIFYQLVGETVIILAVHGVRQDPEQIKNRIISE